MMNALKRVLLGSSRSVKCYHRLRRQERLAETCSCGLSIRRRYGGEVGTADIPPPHIEGTDKEYSPKIHNIVDEISKLTLVEVCDLNELLKKTLKIQDAPVMAMSAGAVAAAPKEEEEEEEAAPVITKTSFTVKLTAFDATKKIALIKELKNIIPDMNLVQAKKFVESVPQVVKDDIAKDEADNLKKKLEELGGTAEVE